MQYCLNLIVIGNGFDLNLGLKTSYSDFVNSDEYLPLLKNRNTLAEGLKNSHNLNNWIDIENELKKYSQDYPTPEHLEGHFVALKKALMKYLKTIDISSMNKDSQAFLMLSALARTNCIILDFNYTGSTRFILQKSGLNEGSIADRHIKVHGSIEHDDIIFGVEDAAQIHPAHIFLKKSTPQNFKGFDITEFLRQNTELHIFGHSLGETDRTYFQPYFDSVSDYHPTSKNAGKTIIHLYHYGQSSWNGLMAQIDMMTGRQTNVYKKKVDLRAVNTFV